MMDCCADEIFKSSSSLLWVRHVFFWFLFCACCLLLLFFVRIFWTCGKKLSFSSTGCDNKRHLMHSVFNSWFHPGHPYDLGKKTTHCFYKQTPQETGWTLWWFFPIFVILTFALNFFKYSLVLSANFISWIVGLVVYAWHFQVFITY